MYFSKIILDIAQKKYKEIAYIQMDFSYYGKYFSKVKYYPPKDEGVSSDSLRDEDGFWFGLDLDGVIPIKWCYSDKCTFVFLRQEVEHKL